ncbi:SGNH/GDSL hydrolase family protein [Acinetobacter variabilis]|nr:SGNH/GDSL hydrolase family protein [Acinetobacter variabilis]
MGDSITAAANSYCDVIASRYSAILNKSHSKSEACIHRKTPEDTRLILSEEYLNIPTENPPDIITIAAGTNDFVTGTPMSIGTMSDRTNTTFYGALHVLLSGLRARFPSTRIGFISQIPRGGTRYTQYDTNTSDKQKAVVMVCEYYSIPLWEGYKEFGFHPDDSDVMAANLMPDKLHPNNAGHIWYANRIEDFILRLAK